ncbi:MAG: hypothetical protein HRU20_15600 [Pseudomonadales bacterium]|nr:hypothetical protein [Pseudomonadales bacterium]
MLLPRLEDPHTAEIISMAMVNQELPEARELHKKALQGKYINDLDLQHLEGMLHHTHDILPFIQHNKHYAKLTLELIHLYQDIVQQALHEEIALSHQKMAGINANRH